MARSRVIPVEIFLEKLSTLWKPAAGNIAARNGSLKINSQTSGCGYNGTSMLLLHPLSFRNIAKAWRTTQSWAWHLTIFGQLANATNAQKCYSRRYGCTKTLIVRCGRGISRAPTLGRNAPCMDNYRSASRNSAPVRLDTRYVCTNLYNINRFPRVFTSSPNHKSQQCDK